MKKTELRKIIKEELAAVLKEAFSDWEVVFKSGQISKTKLSDKVKYKVKARNTEEAIRKAAAKAGLKGNEYLAADRKSVKKL